VPRRADTSRGLLSRTARLGALALVASAGWASPALAQEKVQIDPPYFDTQLYSLPIDAEATMWTNDAGTAPTGHGLVKLGVHSMTQPLVYRFEDDYEINVIESVVEAQLVGGVTWRFLRFGLDVPFIAKVDGEQIEPESGLGDVSLDIKGAILDREGSDSETGVAALVRLSVPTATVDTSVATDGVGVQIEGIVDRKFGPVLVAANLGQAVVPQETVGNVTWGSYGYGRLGAGWFIVENAGVSVDLTSHLVYGIDFSNPAGHPAEGIIGGFGRLSKLVVVRGGVGTGLSGGIGAPDVRFIGSLGLEPEEVRDKDEDGIPDGIDACPNRPEDIDQFADDDGCPDPRQKVQIKVRNHLGDLVPSATVALETEDGTKEGGSELLLQMHAGSYQVTGMADRYDDTTVTFTVVEGRDTIVELDLMPQFGEVRAVVRDADGVLLSGTMEVDGEPGAKVRGGVGRVDAAAGRRAVVVRVDGYKTVTLPAMVRAGQRTSLEVVMEPAKAKVAEGRIEILEKVFFESGKATIQAASYQLLDEVAGILVDHEEIKKVRVEGHTDSRGSASANRRLSGARAESVRNYLIAKGVAGDRLEAVGHGEDKPLDASNTRAAHDKNRRVEFVIVDPAPAE